MNLNEGILRLLEEYQTDVNKTRAAFLEKVAAAMAPGEPLPLHPGAAPEKPEKKPRGAFVYGRKTKESAPARPANSRARPTGTITDQIRQAIVDLSPPYTIDAVAAKVPKNIGRKRINDILCRFQLQGELTKAGRGMWTPGGQPLLHPPKDAQPKPGPTPIVQAVRAGLATFGEKIFTLPELKEAVVDACPAAKEKLTTPGVIAEVFGAMREAGEVEYLGREGALATYRLTPQFHAAV